MNAPQISAQPAVRDIPTVNPDTAWFFDFLFGTQSGWLCLGYIDGDPSIKKDQPGYSPIQSEWYHVPRQRTEVLQRFAQLDQRRVNIYVRHVLFTKKRGTKDAALPSAIIWRDDVKDAQTPCSVLIETSAANYQALIRLDRPATTDERGRLMTTWRNAHGDSDACSADPVHFVRVPGGHNTKGHGWYTVSFARQSEYIYNVDRLLARCSEETHTLSGRASAARSKQHRPDSWSNLPDGTALLASKRWQGIINSRPQLRQLLIERQRVTLTNKNGKQDDSDSNQIAVFIRQTITASPYSRVEHLPECEIRAVALELKDYLRPGLSLIDYQVDIDCLIEKDRPKNYRPVATLFLAGQARPVVKRTAKTPRGRAGNHAVLVEQVYQALLDSPIITTGGLASSIGCDRRTIAEILKELRGESKERPGPTRIQTQRLARHAGLAVTILDVIYSAVQAPVLAIKTPQTPIVVVPPHEETEEESVFLQDRATDHSYPSLAELAAHYLDQPAPDIGMQCVNTQTGLVTYRRTAKHFAALVVADYGSVYTVEQALDAYVAEQQHRKDLVAQEWQRFFARLRNMTNDELIAYTAGRCRTEVYEKVRGGTTFDKHLYRVRLKCAKQQLEWRGLTMPSRKTRIEQAAREDAEHADQARRRATAKKRPVACQPVYCDHAVQQCQPKPAGVNWKLVDRLCNAPDADLHAWMQQYDQAARDQRQAAGGD